TNSGAKGKKIVIELENIDGVVTKLLSGLDVNSMSDVNMVELIVSGREPETIKAIANTLADEYVIRSLEDKRLQASSTRRFIEEQLERIKTNLDEAGKDLMDFKREEGIIDISSETNRRIATMSSLENRILEESINRQIKRRELGELRRRAEILGAPSPETDDIPDVDFSYFAEDSKIGAIEQRIVKLQDERAGLMVTHTTDHPDVKRIDEEITRLNDQLSSELDKILEEGTLATDINLADKNIGYLQGSYDDYYNYLSDIPEKELELNRLTRKYQVNESIYFSLMEKLQESKIRESMENADIRVIDYAITPRKPTSPNHLKNISIGLALGVMLGLVLVFILEFADTSISSVEEVERLYNYPVVGIIPAPEALKGLSGSKTRNGFDQDFYTIALDRPKSPISEAFRALRTAVLTAAVDKDKYSLAVTSSSLSEGKSNTIVNLAIVLAQIGKSTVIVDSDLRRSVLYKALGQEKTPGLSELLLGEAKLKDCLHETGQEGLMVITCGQQPPNPSELLGSKKLVSLINDLHKKFDFVLFDAPPVLAVTDPLILSGITDGTLFVISAGNTDRKAARRALQILEQTKCHIIGIVLNQVKLERSLGGYGYKYYAQYYSSYEADDS
ncbi:MAG: polysaccharide biosynthesis tyrosine autokinase, partial [bacterium]|nr:polysaccharide biosynthesis tyrosine autokinase [bacterium]